AIKKDSGEIYIEDGGSKSPVSFDDVFMMVAEPDLPKFLTGYEFIRFFIDANKENIKDLKGIDYYLDLVDFDEEDSRRLIQSYSTSIKSKSQILLFII